MFEFFFNINSSNMTFFPISSSWTVVLGYGKQMLKLRESFINMLTCKCHWQRQVGLGLVLGLYEIPLRKENMLMFFFQIKFLAAQSCSIKIIL